jgi:type II secretory pathway pseudopilin PulG
MKDRIIPLVIWILVASILLLAAAGLVLSAFLRRNPQLEAARADLAELQRTLDAYRSAHGRYPETIQDLFSTPPEGGKPYLEPARSRDPWGNLYRYSKDGKVWSMGPDGWDHTADDVYP